MRYRITHVTEYRYAATVSECHNVAHLIPLESATQRCLSAGVQIDPLPDEYAERQDFFGNRVSHFSVQQPHERLTVTAVSEVETRDGAGGLDLHSAQPWEEVARRLRESSEPELLQQRQFLLESPLIRPGAALRGYARGSFAPGRPAVETVLDLMRRIHHDFEYDAGFSNVSTPLQRVLEHRRGVCQDFAHLAIGCLRAMGLPARYVSGYLETLPPPGQPRLVGADASHAWFSVYLPAEGWLDFDPTNNQMPMERHVATAYGRDFSDVTPIKGVIFGGGERHDLRVAVDVEPVG